jgi:Retron-type reverse transcriptase
VTANKGASGIDGMQTDELRDYLNTNWQTLRSNILTGNYKPQAVRKVEIPKAGGNGLRMIGIPTVVDRLLGQAIAQWLSPSYEPSFSGNSYGFRPGRNAHQAVLNAQRNLNSGHRWIIELDLEKFFDRVNHDKVMHSLSEKVKDKRTLKLIRSFLSSGIMENGLVSPRKEGTVQGSPLSPLISNILLDQLDQELEKRGHVFVRYADDISIYVKSKKSALRVMGSIISFIENDLKLKVNGEKSKVSRPSRSTLLGFSFYGSKTGWEIRIAPKALRSIREKMKQHTKRNDPIGIKDRIRKIELSIRGWVNYFALAKAKNQMLKLDEMMRVRLRIIIWKQWKHAKTRQRNLMKLGVSRGKAYEWSHTRKGYCRTAHSPTLQRSVTNAYLNGLEYTGFANYYYWKTEHQTKLF